MTRRSPLLLTLLSTALFALGCEAIATFDRDKLDPVTAPPVVIPVRDGGASDAGRDGGEPDADLEDAALPDDDAGEPDGSLDPDGGLDAAADAEMPDADLPDAELDASGPLDDAGDASDVAEAGDDATPGAG